MLLRVLHSECSLDVANLFTAAGDEQEQTILNALHLFAESMEKKENNLYVTYAQHTYNNNKNIKQSILILKKSWKHV